MVQVHRDLMECHIMCHLHHQGVGRWVIPRLMVAVCLLTLMAYLQTSLRHRCVQVSPINTLHQACHRLLSLHSRGYKVCPQVPPLESVQALRVISIPTRMPFKCRDLQPLWPPRIPLIQMPLSELPQP